MNLVHVSALLALVASCGSLSARVPTPRSEEVLYHVSFPAPQTQHVSISTVFPTGGRDELVVSLPTWRPGRYHILNPAGTLRGFTARTPDGTQLQARKTAVSTWAITTLGAPRVVIDYTIYANSLGDRTRHVDPTHAFLSGSSVFLYSDRLRSAPLTVEVDLPTGWDIATGLERVPGREDAVAAPNYDVLVDSPLEIGLHDRVTFTVADTPHEFIYWPPGIERDDERIIEDATKIIEAQRAIFGRLPYERYVFLVHGSEARGGTEHLNSTIMQTSRAALEGSRENDDAYKGFLSLLAHEFFHTWNVKQLRPAGIHPYDYQHENLSDMLWVCEGTTSYYAALTRTRAGLTKPDKYLEGLGKAAAGLLRSPATAVQSVAEASRDAWIDARNADSANSSVDIYGKGSLVSFCLDMEVRKRTENRVSLDDVMRTMFERFPLDGPGYRRQDMVAVLDELTGTEFSGWFASYVTGTDKLPYRESVGAVGLEFVFEPTEHDDEDAQEDGTAEENQEEIASATEETPMKPYLGIRLSSRGSGSSVRTLLADGPAYGSGLLVGDEILTLDRRRLTPAALDELLEDKEPGDTVHLHVLRRDELLEFDIVLAGIPDGTWKLRRVEEPTDAQRAAYASWLGSPWPGGDEDEPEEDQVEGGPED